MTKVFDENAQNYSDAIDRSLDAYGTNHEYFTQHKAWLIGHVLESLGRASLSVDLLDVGCGVGKIHGYIGSRFRSISGVDVSAASIRVARETFSTVDYRDYDGKRLPYSDASFDMTMAICVFHHIPPDLWETVAGEMMRVLRPGGIVLVIEHNPYNPLTRRIVNNCPLDEDAVLLTPSRLRQVFRNAGAGSANTRAILNIPPARPWLRKLDLSLGRIPIGAQYYLLANAGGK